MLPNINASRFQKQLEWRDKVLKTRKGEDMRVKNKSISKIDSQLPRILIEIMYHSFWFHVFFGIDLLAWKRISIILYSQCMRVSLCSWKAQKYQKNLFKFYSSYASLSFNFYIVIYDILIF